MGLPSSEPDSRPWMHRAVAGRVHAVAGRMHAVAGRMHAVAASLRPLVAGAGLWLQSLIRQLVVRTSARSARHTLSTTAFLPS